MFVAESEIEDSLNPSGEEGVVSEYFDNLYEAEKEVHHTIDPYHTDLDLTDDEKSVLATTEKFAAEEFDAEKKNPIEMLWLTFLGMTSGAVFYWNLGGLFFVGVALLWIAFVKHVAMNKTTSRAILKSEERMHSIAKGRKVRAGEFDAIDATDNEN